MIEKNGSFSSRWITLNLEDIRLDILELTKLLNQQQNLIISKNDNENEVLYQVGINIPGMSLTIFKVERIL